MHKKSLIRCLMELGTGGHNVNTPNTHSILCKPQVYLLHLVLISFQTVSAHTGLNSSVSFFLSYLIFSEFLDLPLLTAFSYLLYHTFPHVSSLTPLSFFYSQPSPPDCSLVFILSSHPVDLFFLRTSSPPCRSPPYMPSHPAHGAVAVRALKRSTVRSDTSPPYQKPFLKTQRGSTWGKTQSLCVNTHAHRSIETLLSMPAQREEN